MHAIAIRPGKSGEKRPMCHGWAEKSLAHAMRGAATTLLAAALAMPAGVAIVVAAEAGPAPVVSFRVPAAAVPPDVARAAQPAVDRAWLPPGMLPASTPRAPVVQLAPPRTTPIGQPGVLQSNQEAIPPGTQSVYLRNTEVPPIQSLTIDIHSHVGGELPPSVDRIPSMESQLGSHEFHRAMLNYSYRWEAPAFYRNPLYFEQPNLERYGYDWGIAQPFISAAQFYVKIPLLPYMMTVHPPCEHVYSLGYYRPGDCVPYQFNWPEARLDAAFVEGAFITGLVFLIP